MGVWLAIQATFDGGRTFEDPELARYLGETAKGQVRCWREGGPDEEVFDFKRKWFTILQEYGPAYDPYSNPEGLTFEEVYPRFCRAYPLPSGNPEGPAFEFKGGWVSPEGVFYPCTYKQHDEWA